MKQILIVEDDELLNKMLVYNLQSESYGIVSVETVKEAMEVLKSQPFDLVLLDINLPDGDGYAIAKTIREKYSDTIVIFLTANDRESDEIRGYELGAVDYITKPFSIHSLQRKVENVLRMMRHHVSMQDVFDDGRLFLNFAEQTAMLGGEAIDLIDFGVSDAEPVLPEPQSCINKKTVVGKNMGLYRELCGRAYVNDNVKPHPRKD